MRLPFPERIPLYYVFCFATLLCTAQLLQGTSGLFAFCAFLFILIAAATFNLAGGFTRPSGAYVFFFAVLGVIVGLFWKAVIGEPADSNLEVPLVTIRVYLAGICAMFAAVYVSRKLTPKRAFLGAILTQQNLQNATIGCMVTGIFIAVLDTVIPHQDGSMLSALAQVDRFLPMAIILGVIYQIRKSGGTTSINLPILISFGVIFLNGAVNFSKEGLLTPFFCWIVAACSLRYRLSLYQVVGGIRAGLFIFQFLVPYSQYGRAFKTTSLSDNFNTSISLLSDLEFVRQQNEILQAESHEEIGVAYYNTPQGFFDRLQMIAMDDALNNITEQGSVFGMSPIWASFANLVPHFFWPDKPRLYYGTMYAQEIGGLIPEDDTTTGISFTPAAEAFHLERWVGVLVVAPIIWIMLFTLFDSLCGDTTKSPWGLLVIPIFAHSAPEAGLYGAIYLLGNGAVGIVFAALASSYVMPIIGTLLAGPENIAIRRAARVRSVSRRLPPIRSSEG